MKTAILIAMLGGLPFSVLDLGLHSRAMSWGP
jgi:hypothetical protein